MDKRIKAGNNSYEIDQHVDSCPICHKGIKPTLLQASEQVERYGKIAAIDVIYKCPVLDCCRAFIGVFEGPNDIRDRSRVFRLRRVYPFVRRDPEIGDEIEKISPDYVKIFSQASAAEGYGLDEVAGVGYRKALEFLIKDYCIHLDPASEPKIKSSRLGNVIAQRVKDENIKNCAKRATWLGNDETHYERKWQNKDIQDLKNIIKLVVHWIEASLLTEKIQSEMPEKT